MMEALNTDNTKTGLFIRKLRREKAMTQRELADLLHITDRAVSKWERGLCAPDIALLEPLANIFAVTMTELIVGERMNPQAHIPQVEDGVAEAIHYSEKELSQKTKACRAKVTIACAVACVAVLICVVSLWAPVVFQRGNPIPYLLAAADVDEGTPYVRVNVNDSAEVYIARRGICEELLAFVAEKTGFVFQEQAGGAFLFTDEYHELAVQTETYWRYYTVWIVPNVTRQSKPPDGANHGRKHA